MTPERVSQRTFFVVSTLLLAASAAATIAWCERMSAMRDMPMPGGWSMSMMWMRMPGQTWPGAAAMFLGMWLVMMIAMMLPSLLPMLWRYRQAAAATGEARLGCLSLLAGAGYFLIWTLFGAIAFCAGATLAALVMRFPLLARAVPSAIGLIVLIAGALQFSAWKARHLACCRGAHCGVVAASARAALRHGMHLGMHCVHCCFGLTTILLVIGVMDLRAMALVTAAISVERFAPGGARAASAIGATTVVVGVCLIARALG